MRERNVYRGRVLELRRAVLPWRRSRAAHRAVAAEHLARPDRAPAGRAGADRASRLRHRGHAERLRASGRHLRRGLLLYGPPGTGKTLTAMYLAAQMHGRTAVLLTGQSLGSRGRSIDLATALQPAMVILEDVDLVAMDRSHEPTNAILFELLNGMDGLDEDHDILFVLTTNRPDLLEPALAARPGRVDQAVELAAPGRRRPATADRALRRRPRAPAHRATSRSSRRSRASAPLHPRAASRAALLAADDSPTAPSASARPPRARPAGAPPRRRRSHQRAARRTRPGIGRREI